MRLILDRAEPKRNTKGVLFGGSLCSVVKLFLDVVGLLGRDTSAEVRFMVHSRQTVEEAPCLSNHGTVAMAAK